MSFSKDIASFTVDAMKATDEVKRAAVIRLFFYVTQLTPVRDGRAINNWFATGKEPSTKITTKVDRSGQESENRIRRTVYGLKDASIIQLTNNLPYIKRLEYGWSDQAPAGMVRVAITQFERYLAEEAKRRGI